MSKSISRILHSCVLAKYTVSPIPISLTHSLALLTHFQSLTPGTPLVQYKHPRNPQTGKREGVIQMVLYDPLPSGEEDASRASREWKERARQVFQRPFRHKLAGAADMLASRQQSSSTSSTEEQTELELRTWLDGLDPWTNSPPAQESNDSALLADPASLSSSSSIERGLLDTSQVILGPALNQPVTLPEYILSSPAQDFTVYELDLVLMTRDPEVVERALAPNKHQQHKVNTTETELAALERLHDAYFPGKGQIVN